MSGWESIGFSGEVDPPLDGHKIESGSMVALRCKRGETGLPTSSISPNAYWSFIGENRARASDRVIHPRSPTGRALSDADNASSSTALSLRASGGVDVPGANAALMVFHIPMTERYIAALHGTTAAFLGSLELEASGDHPAATASRSPQLSSPDRLLWVCLYRIWQVIDASVVK